MEKYYTEKQIYASTFFGGPIPPGILIYKNLKRIGDDKNASLTLLATFVFTVLLFYGVMQLPEAVLDKLPNILFTSIYTGVVYLIYNQLLADRINDKIVEPENRMSNWNVTGFTVMGVITSLLIIFVFAIYSPAFPGEKMEYGEVKHEIFFDKGEVPEADLDKVGQILTEFEYFNNEVRQAVRIDYVDNAYQLNLPMQKESWANLGLIRALNALKASLNAKVGKEFKLILIHYELSGETIIKEI
ncbi:MAG: hypothetical protein ACQESW_13485 [Bacteroidota bacterium]